MTVQPPASESRDASHDVEGVLQPGERLLWTGAPVPGLRLRGLAILQIGVGLPFLFAGVFALASAGQILDEPEKSPIGLAVFVTLLVGAGGYLAFVPIIRAYITSRHVRYALSTQAAFIVKDWPIPRMEIYPILFLSEVELEKGREAGTVWFHTRKEEGSEGGINKTRIGFARLSDAATAFRLIGAIQTGDPV